MGFKWKLFLHEYFKMFKLYTNILVFTLILILKSSKKQTQKLKFCKEFKLTFRFPPVVIQHLSVFMLSVNSLYCCFDVSIICFYLNYHSILSWLYLTKLTSLEELSWSCWDKHLIYIYICWKKQCYSLYNATQTLTNEICLVNHHYGIWIGQIYNFPNLYPFLPSNINHAEW